MLSLRCIYLNNRYDLTYKQFVCLFDQIASTFLIFFISVVYINNIGTTEVLYMFEPLENTDGVFVVIPRDKNIK